MPAATSTSYHAGELTGLVTVLLIAAYVLHRALTRGFGGHPRQGRNAVIAVVAVLGACACVASAASSGLFDKASASGPVQSGAWLSLEGQALRAGFISGCSNEQARATAICECVFAHVAATARYRTPARFESLAGEIHAEQDGGAVPPELLAAVHACRGGSY